MPPPPPPPNKEKKRKWKKKGNRLVIFIVRTLWLFSYYKDLDYKSRKEMPLKMQQKKNQKNIRPKTKENIIIDIPRKIIMS